MSDWDQEKKDRRRLRTRQRALRRNFLKRLPDLSLEQWIQYREEFSGCLSEDVRLDPNWIDTDRYLLALYNIFSALDFKVFSGEVPRISGVQPDYRFPLFAYSNDRALLIENGPTSLFADLADVQPLCPVPIIGVSYNSIVCSEVGPRQWSYPAKSLMESKRVAAALALGHLTLSFNDLREALVSHPDKDKAALLSIANRTGLLSFLHPPIDSLPIYGQYASASYQLGYNPEQFLEDAERTASAGASLGRGDVTQAMPREVLSDPDYYFKQLEKSRLVKLRSGSGISTSEGLAYLRSRVLPFPLGQLLYHTCLAAREEIRVAAGSAFREALEADRKSIISNLLPMFVTLDDLDSFANVRLVPAREVKQLVPVSDSEGEIKRVLEVILGEPFKQQDWGGEQNDIFTSRVMRDGKRVLAAFMLKGPSVRGRLTLAKCGKNGDQIQRLFQSPAELFIVQFNGPVDERVFEECKQKTEHRRTTGASGAAFCVIDGVDTARLLTAYRDGLTRPG